MTGVLLVAVIVLAIITIGNVALLWAVIRRLRYVQEVVAPPLPVPIVGTEVAPFQALSVDGTVVDERVLAGERVLVAIVSSTCPACSALARALVSARIPSDSLLVLVVRDPDHDTKPLFDTLSGTGTLVAVDRDDDAMHAFGHIGAFPTVVVAEQLKIVASGTRLDDVLPTFNEAAATSVS